ncbi:MAG: MlaD family protein, partial [Sulfurimonadaceae bacterium]|nr:MlaD family protein [Sulfurimonadaceae bacterium]
LIITFVYWLMKPTDDTKMRPYKIFFTESVSGLNIDSPVKYRGITVGKVKEMMINPENNEEIQINISIDANTPVKTDTVATLIAQGITGLVFIDLSEGSKGAPLLQPAKGEYIAVIPSVPSFFERVGETLGDVTSKLSRTLDSTSDLLNHGNQERIAEILEHTSRTMSQIEKLLNDRAINDIHTLLASASSASQQLDALMPRIEHLVSNSVAFEDSVSASFVSIMNTYKGIGEAMDVFKEKNENGHYSVKDNIAQPMKEFELSMRELQRTLATLNRVLESYETNPSDMIFKSESPNIGPGEK